MGSFSENIADEVRRKIFDDIIHANKMSAGQIFWVIEDSDEDYQRMMQDHPKNVFTTVEAAYAATTSNRNDIIFLNSQTAHTISAMLTVDGNRTHFVGMDGGGRQTGHGSRLVMGVTTAATDIAVVKVTGVRNSFTNIKIESNNTVAEGLYALVDAGEYTCWRNCSFLKLTDLDQASAADVVAGGDSTTWRNCEFGAATLKATAARPVMIIDKSLAGSNGMMDNNFFECNFVSYTSSSSRVFIKLVANQDGQRYAMFRSCAFINWDIIATGTTMTNAVYGVSGQTQLYLIFDANTIVVGCTNFAASANNAGVYICAPVPTAATSGIAVNAA